jgi:uncharacterized protein YjaG (DUF416 family)
MNNEEFLNILGKRLERLSSPEVIDFALNICHRLLPHYMKFCEEYSWGSMDTLSKGIRYCENLESLETVGANELLDLMQQIEKAIPDTEEFEDGSLALNASAAVLELIEYALDRDLSHIINISSFMTDTVDFVAREERIDLPVNHQVLIEERKYQLELASKIN